MVTGAVVGQFELSAEGGGRDWSESADSRQEGFKRAFTMASVCLMVGGGGGAEGPEKNYF